MNNIFSKYIIDGKCILPDTIIKIKNWSFSECEALTSIEIPDSVTEIGAFAFEYCTGLTSIKIPDSVTDIGCAAFRGCTSLERIEVSENNQHYCSVDNCCLTRDGKTLVFGCKSSIIPNSVTRIEVVAFNECEELTSIKIPGNVTEIVPGAFSGLTCLERIEVSENNQYYCSVNNCCLTKDGKTLVFGCKTSIIPDGVTEISYAAFDGCIGLTSVIIPNSVTKIGKIAFANCTELTSIKIPDNITDIGDGAFDGCYQLIQDITSAVNQAGR